MTFVFKTKGSKGPVTETNSAWLPHAFALKVDPVKLRLFPLRRKVATAVTPAGPPPTCPETGEGPRRGALLARTGPRVWLAIVDPAALPLHLRGFARRAARVGNGDLALATLRHPALRGCPEAQLQVCRHVPRETGRRGVAAVGTALPGCKWVCVTLFG